MRTLIRGGAAAFAAALLLLAAPVGADAAGQAASGTEAPQTRLIGVVNINTATPEQLELLPGVGPARARRIIEFRKTHGSFRKVEELVQVSGIGEKALVRMRPHCRTSGKTTSELTR